MDFRNKPREAFIEWFRWSLENQDCDPAIFMMNYLFDRFELNIEQKLWFCWIYGTTYHVPAAWVIHNEFPDFELVDQGRLEDWNSKNYKRLRYQTDTRYNKGHLPSQFASYRKWIGEHQTQKSRFLSILTGTPEENFVQLWDTVIKDLHKFGRYSTWFYLQALRSCVGMKIEPSSLMLHDYSGSKSHRNGLCLALGKPEWYNEKLDKKDIAFLEKNASDILEEVKSKNTALNPSMFEMETCLCSFKKIFRVKDGRYLGYYLDRQAEEISKVERDGWDGINWKPLWDARIETIKPHLIKSKYIQVEKMENGQFDNLHGGEDSESSILEMFGV
jgi:hypothetical protein